MINSIFLADDDGDAAYFFKYVLVGLNKAVNLPIAVNGLNPIALLEHADTLQDLVFSYLNIPLKTFFQCLKEIKSQRDWNLVKIIIHFATSQQEQIDKAYTLQADRYLPKITEFREYRQPLQMPAARLAKSFIEISKINFPFKKSSCNRHFSY